MLWHLLSRYLRKMKALTLFQRGGTAGPRPRGRHTGIQNNKLHLVKVNSVQREVRLNCMCFAKRAEISESSLVFSKRARAALLS